jgi:uncharacterized NAD(P)/FAD-binding protein YdhS
VDRLVSPSRTVAIVGGGVSGAFVAVQLLRLARAPLEIALIDRSGRFGRGVAFGTASEFHLLNVRAGSMSALPDDPDHFVRWLHGPSDNGPAPGGGPEDFLPRSVYGAYVAAALDEAERAAVPGVTLRRLVGEAVAARPSRGSVSILLADGSELPAAHAVLALGNRPPTSPAAPGLSRLVPSRYVSDPWTPGALEAVAADGPVLLVGTGLTMVDVALVLAERGVEGPLHAVSRRGKLPRSHAPLPPQPLTPLAPGESIGLSDLVRRVREVSTERSLGEPEGWRAVVDGLRPRTQELWQGFSELERRRFLRHVRPYWDTARHRIAPDVARRLEGLLRSGTLRPRAARLVRVEAEADGARVWLRGRGAVADESLLVTAIVNCTGPGEVYAGTVGPLVDGLFQSGAARPGPLGLGLDAGPDGLLIGADGVRSTVLSTLGPPRKGSLWETLAVPEIRAQARDLALAILA